MTTKTVIAAVLRVVLSGVLAAAVPASSRAQQYPAGHQRDARAPDPRDHREHDPRDRRDHDPRDHRDHDHDARGRGEPEPITAVRSRLVGEWRCAANPHFRLTLHQVSDSGEVRGILHAYVVSNLTGQVTGRADEALVGRYDHASRMARLRPTAIQPGVGASSVILQPIEGGLNLTLGDGNPGCARMIRG